MAYEVLLFLALTSIITGNMPAINYPVREREMRAALLSRLALRSAQGQVAVVREEVPVGRARIDVLALSDCLEGFELKSDFDSLTRLERQVQCFSSTLDKVTLVVGHEHLVHARQFIPKWWGVLLAERARAGGIRFEQVREPAENPADVLLGLAGLLWRNELLDVFERLTGREPPKSASAEELRRKIAASSSANAVRAIVMRRLQDVERLVAWEAAQPSRPVCKIRFAGSLRC